MATTCLTLNPLSFNVMGVWCLSWAKGYDKTHVPVPYDYKTTDKSEGDDPADSIQLGADLLDDMIHEYVTETDDVVVFSHSKGSQVVGRWLIKYGDTSDISSDKLSFVTTGNPTSSLGHVPWIKYPTPTSVAGGYSIIDIGRREDYWCRWKGGAEPNIFEWTRNIMGMLLVHTNYFAALLNEDGSPYGGIVETSTVEDTKYYTIL